MTAGLFAIHFIFPTPRFSLAETSRQSGDDFGRRTSSARSGSLPVKFFPAFTSSGRPARIAHQIFPNIKSLTAAT